MLKFAKKQNPIRKQKTTQSAKKAGAYKIVSAFNTDPFKKVKKTEKISPFELSHDVCEAGMSSLLIKEKSSRPLDFS